MGSTLVDLICVFKLELNYLEQREIPFFLLIEIEVASLFGKVFLLDNIFDSLRMVYFLFEFAVLRLFDVEYEDWTKL